MDLPLTQIVKILQNSSPLHHSSRITQYISHITYDFEVRQNIKVNNDSAVLNKTFSSLPNIFVGKPGLEQYRHLVKQIIIQIKHYVSLKKEEKWKTIR